MKDPIREPRSQHVPCHHVFSCSLCSIFIPFFLSSSFFQPYYEGADRHGEDLCGRAALCPPGEVTVDHFDLSCLFIFLSFHFIEASPLLSSQGYRAEMEDPSMSNLLPSALRSQKDVLFGNMPEIYQFHSRQDTHTYTHTEPTSCHTVVLISPSSYASPIFLHDFLRGFSIQDLPPRSAGLPGNAREGGVLLPATGEET